MVPLIRVGNQTRICRLIHYIVENSLTKFLWTLWCIKSSRKLLNKMLKLIEFIPRGKKEPSSKRVSIHRASELFIKTILFLVFKEWNVQRSKRICFSKVCNCFGMVSKPKYQNIWENSHNPLFATDASGKMQHGAFCWCWWRSTLLCIFFEIQKL